MTPHNSTSLLCRGKILTIRYFLGAQPSRGTAQAHHRHPPAASAARLSSSPQLTLPLWWLSLGTGQQRTELSMEIYQYVPLQNTPFITRPPKSAASLLILESIAPKQKKESTHLLIFHRIPCLVTTDSLDSQCASLRPMVFNAFLKSLLWSQVNTDEFSLFFLPPSSPRKKNPTLCFSWL